VIPSEIQKTEVTEQRANPCRWSFAIRHLLFWPIFGAGLILDLWSKYAVFNWLANQGHDGFTIINGFLKFQLAVNPGAAFGMAAGHKWQLVMVSVVALVVDLAFFLFGWTKRKIVLVAQALFAAGVCGNLYDRLFNGGLVRDFIDVVYWPGKHWPAFNVADSMLCIAVGLLLLSSFYSPRRSSSSQVTR
jgi:signal peptidase II